MKDDKTGHICGECVGDCRKSRRVYDKRDGNRGKSARTCENYERNCGGCDGIRDKNVDICRKRDGFYDECGKSCAGFGLRRDMTGENCRTAVWRSGIAN